MASGLLWFLLGLSVWPALRALRFALSGAATIVPDASVRGLHIDVNLTYRDAHEERTERLVTVREIEGPKRRDGTVNVHLLRGYCHLSKGPRTFRMDRVVRAADTDGVLIDGLQSWLRQKIADRPDPGATPEPKRGSRKVPHR